MQDNWHMVPALRLGSDSRHEDNYHHYLDMKEK
jgi:hypothetical protein